MFTNFSSASNGTQESGSQVNESFEQFVFVLIIFKFLLPVLGILILWRSPKAHPPLGLDTNDRSSPEALAQVVFLPLVLLQVVNVLVIADEGASSLGIQLTEFTHWLSAIIIALLMLLVALLYWPVHMALGSVDSIINRCVGAIIIAFNFMYTTISLLTELVSEYIGAVTIITIYVPNVILTALAFVWLAYPPLLLPIIKWIDGRYNRKLFSAFYLCSFGMLIFIYVCYNIFSYLGFILVLLGLMNSQIAIFLSWLAPTIAYIIILTANIISFQQARKKNVRMAVQDSELVRVEVDRFSFVGYIIGYQLMAFTFISTIAWAIMTVCSFAAGPLFKWLFFAVIVPIAIVQLMKELIRAAVGWWLIGPKYRPFPRQQQLPLHRRTFNIYWTHFEFFVLFNSILRGFVGLFKIVLLSFIKSLLGTIMPNPNGNSLIDTGFMTPYAADIGLVDGGGGGDVQAQTRSSSASVAVAINSDDSEYTTSDSLKMVVV